MTPDTAALVTAEQERARAKHAGNALATLPAIANGHHAMLYHLHLAGQEARRLCDRGPASKLAVLVEEVAEVADDVLLGRDPDDELVQVAAMAAEWRESL
jgi:hypothetical protein